MHEVVGSNPTVSNFSFFFWDIARRTWWKLIFLHSRITDPMHEINFNKTGWLTLSFNFSSLTFSPTLFFLQLGSLDSGYTRKGSWHRGSAHALHIEDQNSWIVACMRLWVQIPQCPFFFLLDVGRVLKFHLKTYSCPHGQRSNVLYKEIDFRTTYLKFPSILPCLIRRDLKWEGSWHRGSAHALHGPGHMHAWGRGFKSHSVHSFFTFHAI